MGPSSHGMVNHTTDAWRALSTSAAAWYSDSCHVSSGGSPGRNHSPVSGSCRGATSQIVKRTNTTSGSNERIAFDQREPQPAQPSLTGFTLRPCEMGRPRPRGHQRRASLSTCTFPCRGPRDPSLARRSHRPSRRRRGCAAVDCRRRGDAAVPRSIAGASRFFSTALATPTVGGVSRIALSTGSRSVNATVRGRRADGVAAERARLRSAWASTSCRRRRAPR